MLQFPVENCFPPRFVNRISAVFPYAMEQMQTGGKITSQMWKLFPGLRALAKSHVSEVFSLRDVREAKLFLLHPVLGPQLTAFCEAVLARPDKNDDDFLSPLCASTLQASMTLFSMASEENSVFHRMLEELFHGETDPRTVARLTKEKAMVIRDGILLDCFGYSGELVIPDGVTAIDARVFYARNDLHTVILPDGLERIGKAAFFNCRNLVSVRMPETVTHIATSAFSDCVSLRDITLPENLEELGNFAFFNCDSLISINIPKQFRGVNTRAFDHLCLLADNKGARNPAESKE